MEAVTQILSKIESGDPSAAEQLLPLVYHELRNLAAARMAQEPSDHTLQATALVHEAYVRMVDVDRVQRWDSRGHFFAAAAEAMRRILIERARRNNTIKRGGSRQRVDLDAAGLSVDDPEVDLLSLNDALVKLEELDPEKAKLVKLRFFTGLTIAQAADAMGISTSTAGNYWSYARCWLRVEMSGEE